MPTPSIQTLRADAQQVLNLDSISAVRSVVAATLANANAGTPLNPNLTTQQLWNEFYQIVTQPKSDIESIIANQLMKFLFAPPAPGGAGADKQVIFNDGGVLAGDADFQWDKTLNRLAIVGSQTITGDLTVRTNKLKVDSTGVAIGAAVAGYPLDVTGISRFIGDAYLFSTTGGAAVSKSLFFGSAANTTAASIYSQTATASSGILNFTTQSGGVMTDRLSISDTGVFTFQNVGGVAGTAMTLNSTGLGIGVTPSAKLDVAGNARVQLAFFTGGTLPGLANDNPFAFRFSGGGLGLGAATETGTSSPIILYTGQGGVERVRVKATGQVRFFPLASDPGGAEAGDVYYNSTSNKLKCYNGTSWNDLF